MYADDTSLGYQSLEIKKLNEGITNDLKKLQKWLMGNKLSLSAMKSQYMHISTKRKHTKLRNQDLNLSLKIMELELEVVDWTTNEQFLRLEISF